jgi:hypothetical protein
MCRLRLAATQLRTSLFAFAALFCLTAAASAQTRSTPPAALHAQWVGTWATAPFGGDPWHEIPTLVGSTVRQIVHTSIAGMKIDQSAAAAPAGCCFIIASIPFFISFTVGSALCVPTIHV